MDVHDKLCSDSENWEKVNLVGFLHLVASRGNADQDTGSKGTEKC